MQGHHYPPGISATGHFRPSVSLFASCFFTMTGFHGAHVTGGVIMLAIIFLQSLRGIYTRHNFISVELAAMTLIGLPDSFWGYLHHIAGVAVGTKSGESVDS